MSLKHVDTLTTIRFTARSVEGEPRRQNRHERGFVVQLGNAPESEPRLLWEVMRYLGCRSEVTQAEKQKFEDTLDVSDSAEILLLTGPRVSFSAV